MIQLGASIFPQPIRKPTRCHDSNTEQLRWKHKLYAMSSHHLLNAWFFHLGYCASSKLWNYLFTLTSWPTNCPDWFAMMSVRSFSLLTGPKVQRGINWILLLEVILFLLKILHSSSRPKRFDKMAVWLPSYLTGPMVPCEIDLIFTSRYFYFS